MTTIEMMKMPSSSLDVECQQLISPQNDQLNKPTRTTSSTSTHNETTNHRRVSVAMLALAASGLLFGSIEILRLRKQQLRGPAPKSALHYTWHPKERKKRFPSVDERVRLYMSDWYLPPCDTSSQFVYDVSPSSGALEFATVDIQQPAFDRIGSSASSITVSSEPFSGHVVNIRRKSLAACDTNLENRYFSHSYCDDLRRDATILGIDVPGTPVLGFMGDNKPESFLGASKLWAPLLSKYRGATSKQDLVAVSTCGNDSSGNCTCVGNRERLRLNPMYQGEIDFRHKPVQPFSPIIWKLHVARHFGEQLGMVREAPVAWEDKIPKALWRGGLTGTGRAHPYMHDVPKDKRSTENSCLYIPRCSFVQRYVNASDGLLDVAFVVTKTKEKYIWAREKGLTKDRMTIEEQLRYKILINLEGNDVSSGLKWMLLSTSVVLMSPPTRTSWAMEELLEPFVHYVPLAENGSNAEEMVRWILDNDEKAQRIAERATLFMEDMLYHPDAEKDEQKIKREIMKRYRAHWTPTP